MKLFKIILVSIFLLAAILRFYDIGSNPPGLYIDEVSIGNSAYSILKTGRDDNGERLPLFFRAFGEYKMPVYIYSVSASMFFFGKNEFAVRFPSALTGTLSVVLFYFLLKKLLELDKSKFLGKSTRYLPIVSTFFLAISSWHLQFSRAGFEVNFALFLFLLASFLVVSYFKSKNFYFLLAGYIFYLIAIYTYDTYRVVSPVVLAFLTLFIFLKIPKDRIKLILLSIFCFLLLLPMIQFSLTPDGIARFSQTSAFVEYSAPNIVDKIKVYSIVFVKNYLSYFSFNYLFNIGDGIGRHQIPDFGVLSLWQFPFILAGLYVLFKEKRSYLKYFVLGILILSPIPAAVARPSPHTLRNLLSVIPFIMLVSIGIIFVLSKAGKWFKLLLILLVFITTYSFLFYLHFYYVHYPQVNILDWGGGYKQIVEEASNYNKKGFKIVIDDKYNYALIYFTIYNSNIYPKPEFISFNKDWEKPKEWVGKKILYIGGNYKGSILSVPIKSIYLSNQNHDVFVRFWQL